MYTNIENYQQKVLRSEFNLDIFFHMLEPFFMKQPLTDRDEMSLTLPKACELLSSLRRLSFVVCRPLTIHILIFSSETTEPN
jgi:hypothetical protein